VIKIFWSTKTDWRVSGKPREDSRCPDRDLKHGIYRIWVKWVTDSTKLVGKEFKRVKLCLVLNYEIKHSAMKTYGGVHLGSRGRGVVSFAPLPLYPRGWSHRNPLDRRLCWPQT
jgi:hypothetical protein